MHPEAVGQVRPDHAAQVLAVARVAEMVTFVDLLTALQACGVGHDHERGGRTGDGAYCERGLLRGGDVGLVLGDLAGRPQSGVDSR